MVSGYPFDEVREYFSGRAGVDLVLVYGSFARGTAGMHSDVDIAISRGKPLSLDDKMSLQADLSILLGRELDMADLSTAEGIFLHRIMSEGKVVLVTAPSGRAAYEKYLRRALYFNADYYPIYKRDQELRLRRLYAGGRHGS
jgi:predicted nucleotidyltransferase